MFKEKLEEGKVGESQIAQWLKSRGHNILPVYDIEKNQHAGPAVYTSSGEMIIAPDMLVFGNGETIWIEAKHKNAFTWHRNTQKYTTGIDIHHYYQYMKIMSLVDWPVWLLFLHRNGCAKDSDPGPSGLFGQSLKYLIHNENHRSEKWGKHGMVYWAVDKLKHLADYPIVSERS